MKVRVTQAKLAHALTLVGRVASTRTALPVLANVLLKVTSSSITLIATNLEIAIIQTIAGKIEKSGAITIPARLLSDFVSSLPDEPIDIELKDTRLHITTSHYTSTINGVPAEEFPTLPTIQNGKSLSVAAPELKQAIQQTILAAGTDETRPVLTGAYLHTNSDQVFIAATDSYRLAERHLATKAKDQFGLIVPASALGDVLRIIGDGGGEVAVTYNDTQVQFVLGDSQLITRQIDGEFPTYRQLIPEKSDVNFTVDKEQFLNITKVAALFARESAGSVTLHTDNKGQKISITSVASQVGENTSEAEAVVRGDGQVTLNSRYLIDALNVVDSDQVTFHFSGKVSPCVLTPADKDAAYTHIIMPLKS